MFLTSGRDSGGGLLRSLQSKVISGVGWTFMASTSAKLLNFFVTLVLARLLAPEDFGLFALGFMLVTAVAIFRDYGLTQSLIYQKGDVTTYAHSTFVMSACFGVGAWVLIYVLAPVVAKVFGNQELTSPLRLMSVSLVFSSLVMVQSALLEKELEFKRRAAPEFANGIAYAVVSISLAYAGMGVWSMVTGHVAGALAGAVTTAVVADYRPKLEFHGKSAKKTMSYARHLMIASVLTLAFFYIDQAAIGKFLGVVSLGYYSLAFTICNLPATNITHVVNKVMFPAYSQMNTDIPAMRQAYLRTIHSIAVFSVPIAFATWAAAPDFVHTFLKPKWYPAIPLFMVLPLYGLVRSIGATAGSIFMAVGDPKWVYRTNAVMVIMAAPLVYSAAIRYGVMGVAVLFTVAYISGTTLALRKAAHILGMSFFGYWPSVRSSLIASVLSVALGRLAGAIATAPGVRFGLFLIVMLPVYVVALRLLDPEVGNMASSVRRHLAASREVSATK